MILNSIDDLHIPIDIVWDKIKYKNLNLKSKLNLIIQNKKLVHNFDEDIDEIFLHGIKYFDNLNNFIIFGKNKNDSYKYYDTNLKDKYILYGIKSIEIGAIHIMKIMYQLIFPRKEIKTQQELYDYVKRKYEFLFREMTNNPNVLLNINILIICKRDLHQKYPISDISKNNFVIYYPTTDEEIEISSSLFLNKTSLKFVELQCFEHFIKRENNESKAMFLKYRSYLYENIDVLTRSSQFMLFSSIVLYLVGHRSMNDLDLYIHTISEELYEKVSDSFDNNEIFKYIEYQAKGTNKWPHYWDTWLDIWAQKCGAKYFEEILGNPEFHFYYLGVKVISIHCDLVRRVERERPRAFADLIAFRKRYAYKITLPDVPKFSLKYIELTKLSELEKNKYIEKGAMIDEKNNEIKIQEEINIEKFLGTIIYYLKDSYRMEMTLADLKRELHIYDSKESLSSILRINNNNNNNNINNNNNKTSNNNKLERNESVGKNNISVPPQTARIKLVIKKTK